MTSINNRITKLQPYVTSIRFNKGLTVIDTSFKSGWSVPKTQTIGYEKLPDRPNYYMLYGLDDETGVDEILDYVERVIQLNIERELKWELLQTKKKELEELFKMSSLEKCKTLKFNFTIPQSERDDDEMEMDEIPINMSDELIPQSYPIEEEVMPEPFVTTPPIQQEVIPEPIQEVEVPLQIRVTEETDSSLKPVAVAEREVTPGVEAWNKEAQRRTDESASTPLTTAKVGGETFDLPPRERIEVESYDEPEVVCKCDPNDPNAACPACLAYKY
jgi:hypothetical protein